MSTDLQAIVRLLHLAGFLFMAAPFYALIIVNERARFGVSPGYNTDQYMETLIRHQPRRCYFFLGTVGVTGLVLVGWGGWGWAALVGQWPLVIKWVVLATLLSLLSYIHLGIQPKIDGILAPLKPGEALPEASRPNLVKFRTRRKRLASICLFLVLTALIMGARLLITMNTYLVLVFVALAGLFAWRVFRTPVRYGWF